MNTPHKTLPTSARPDRASRRRHLPQLVILTLALLLAGCGAPASNTAAGAPSDGAQAAPAVAGSTAAATAAETSGAAAALSTIDGDLIPLTLGGPVLAAPGLTPKPTSAFGYALERGEAQPILAKYGFTFSGFAPFNNGPPVAQALASGDISIGTLGDTPAVLARAGGLDNRAIVIDRPAGDIWLLGKPGGVTEIADLKGKRVGLQFGSNFDKYGRAALTEAGLIDQVELINLLIADALPALQRGDIDAYALPATTAALWVAKSSFPVIEKASESRPDQLGTSITVVNGGVPERASGHSTGLVGGYRRRHRGDQAGSRRVFAVCRRRHRTAARDSRTGNPA